MTPQEFYGQFFPYAQAVSQRTGLDPRLVLAQAALETGYGRSAPGMNYFGIKSHGRAGGQTLQTSEFEGGRMVSQPASFRGYESPEQSFQDYADFLLTNPRYRGVLSAVGIENQIAEMAKSGYATDPQYGAKLANIANKFDTNAAPIIGADALRAIGKGPSENVTRSTKQGDIMEPITQPQQRQGLLGGFFGPEGRDARARLAIGLEGMTLNPNQALIGQLQQGIEDRKAEGERNRTLEWLSTLKTPEAQRALQYAQATGDVVGAAKMALTPADPMAAINLEKAQLELRRLQSGGFDPEKAFANEVELMKAYRTEPAVQAYNQLSGHYNTMLSAYNTTQTDPAAQGAGDLAMVYSYMKMLDPGSTVMQGEYASASNTSGVPDRVRNTYNAIIEGAGLTPSQRQAFLTQAGGMLQARAQPIAGINELYSGTAQRGGVQPNFLITPPPLPSFIPAVVPQSAVALGVTQEDWDAMTQEERKAFMGGQ